MLIKMLTEKQLKVIEVFRKNLGKKITFNQIKKGAGINSNNFLQKALSDCKKEDLLVSENLGKNVLYSIKLNEKTFSYFSIIPFQLYLLPFDMLNRINKEILEINPLSSLIVFGSYAKKENKKNSDIDIAILVNDKKLSGQIISALESMRLESLIKIDYHIILVNELKEMLSSKNENLGKEIARHNLVLSNSSAFYFLLEKWNH